MCALELYFKASLDGTTDFGVDKSGKFSVAAAFEVLRFKRLSADNHLLDLTNVLLGVVQYGFTFTIRGCFRQSWYL